MEPRQGLRIRMLQKMDDPYRAIEAGEEGVIMYVYDARQIHVKWDNGSSLAVIPEIDHYEVFNPYQSLLNFDGMTPEKKEEFIINTNISFEVDGSINTSIDSKGFLHEGEIEGEGSTGWISGQILSLDVSQNIGLNYKDAYIKALEFFRNANFNLESAADDFDAKYGPLL